MGLAIGIVGLPNVGKSTLFNALTSTQAAESANYPFCTIEPNKGIVSVKDERITQLSKLANSEKVIPTQLEFVDIAGLVRGASKGEGLGNKFLSHIREVDAIAQVLRCFDDEDITHVEGATDPIRDSEIIETELIIADLESVEKRIANTEKKAKGGDKEAIATLELLKAVHPLLFDGKPARVLKVDDDKKEAFRQLQLITSKPLMYVSNVKEEDAKAGNKYTALVEAKAKATAEGAQHIIISAKIEAEIAQLGSDEDKAEFLKDIGLDETGLSKLIHAGYKLLDLITYFTVGPKETRAWTVRRNTKAPQAAGVIHTDFEKGFIRAETVAYSDYVTLGGESGAKDRGKLRLEGKEYVVSDGDVMHFRFNVQYGSIPK